MNTKNRIERVPTRFERPTRFSLKPRFAALKARQNQEIFEDLKARLLQPVLQDAADPLLQRQLRLAAKEAAAMAWTTPFPLLTFPVLLQEKAAEAQEYAVRQEEVVQASHELLETNA